MKLSINILANLFGRIWVAGIGIILVPQYIKFLGIESYGLVGFYGTLIGSMSLLDLGLSTTLNRELTKARVENKDAESTRNLVFTLECVYWAIGFLIAISVFLLAPIIASHRLKAQNLPADTVEHAVMLMGLVVAFQWPISLYNGGMTGLEKQVTDNTIMVCMTTIRSVGVILLLWLVSPTIQMFFIWQAIASCIYVLAMRIGLWHYLPKSVKRVKLSKQQLMPIWRFAAGMTSIGVVTFFLSQIDKIVLSKIVTLTQFAYYMLAFTVAGSLNMIVNPINTAVFPRLTAMVAAKNRIGLVQVYHKACRLVATVVFPAGLILIFFAKDILLIWTKSPVTAINTAKMAQILVAGSIFNSLIVIPYLLMLASGQTRFTFIQNLISAIILVPLLFWWVHLYGAIGGTFVWFTVNFGYILISIPLIHHFFLKGELRTWYIKDTLIPLLPALISVIAIKSLTNKYFTSNLNFIGLVIITVIVFFFSVIFLPETRFWMKRVKLNFLKEYE